MKRWDMTQMRPTDMKLNRRLIMLDAPPTEEELMIQARKSCGRRATEQYIKEHCDDTGNQVESNLSPALARGSQQRVSQVLTLK